MLHTIGHSEQQGGIQCIGDGYPEEVIGQQLTHQRRTIECRRRVLESRTAATIRVDNGPDTSGAGSSPADKSRRGAQLTTRRQ
jgi:hypothetical protein